MVVRPYFLTLQFRTLCWINFNWFFLICGRLTLFCLRVCLETGEGNSCSGEGIALWARFFSRLWGLLAWVSGTSVRLRCGFRNRNVLRVVIRVRVWGSFVCEYSCWLPLILFQYPPQLVRVSPSQCNPESSYQLVPGGKFQFALCLLFLHCLVWRRSLEVMCSSWLFP